MNFGKEFKSKTFILVSISLMALTLLGTAGLFFFDISRTSDDDLRKFRLAKIADVRAIDTVIIGDSSAGAAINAALFSELSGSKTQNLSLTVDFSVVGSFLMLQKALVAHPEIKAVILIQSPEVWRKNLARESFFELMRRPSEQSFVAKTGLVDFMAYVTDLHRPFQATKYAIKKVIAPQRRTTLDPVLEEVTQLPATFANGQLPSPESFRLSETIESVQVAALQLIDDLCRSLRCIFVSGPLHETVLKNSQPELSKILKRVTESAQHIKIVPAVTPMKNEEAGDSINHVAPEFKNEFTKKFYELLKPSL